MQVRGSLYMLCATLGGSGRQEATQPEPVAEASA